MRVGSWMAALGAALLIAPVLAQPGFAASNPAEFVGNIEQRAIQIIGNAEFSPATRRQEFTTVVGRTFDLPAIARFTLGRYWRVATPRQRRQFLGALDAYLVSVYWARLERLQQYPGARLKVVRERPLGARTTLVATQLQLPSGHRPVNLDWTVVRREGRYEILDLSIDNVNQELAERAQFGDLIARNGGSLPALIAMMRTGTSQATG
jgi:phospholipid transport system substrate-binding protein